jgi:hypothetical protein
MGGDWANVEEKVNKSSESSGFFRLRQSVKHSDLHIQGAVKRIAETSRRKSERVDSKGYAFIRGLKGNNRDGFKLLQVK